ncbi:MAG TPA: type I-U CRISPR-associated RAMP protein Csb1/Cas7u [Microthrixaceae bacterium]|nr:type I-U CRISPR-associated protein Cas7 [Actinomycetota bacterium]HNI36267.1 type I-U CRISPR-associated RAMP protein Csb1/Cas7u [Microthrixaceae bacterium]
MTTTTANRLLFDVGLVPVQGSRFAPTGFADLGPALFQRPTGDDGWVDCLLVESAQSMANRLEATMWDHASNAPDDVIASLPFIRVVSPDGDHLTSSREESHRLASAYVRSGRLDDRTGSEIIAERLQLSETAPHDYRRLARAVFALDPLTLVHGVFFSGKGAKEFPGQPKFTRVLSGFIEAQDVRRAESGGVKRDHVNHTQKSSGGDSSEGFGSIPFARTEWTARSITASFNVDLAQLRSYALPEPAERLLSSIARLEIATLLSAPLRLRTNCDLEIVGDIDIVDRSGEPLGTVPELSDQVTASAAECRSEGLFEDGLVLSWKPGDKP